MDRRDGDRRRRRFGGAAFLPSNLANLYWWVRADVGVTESSGDISSVEDHGSSGLNMVQATGLDQPTLISGELGGKPVIRFDGVDHFMTAGVASDWTFMSNGSSFTIFKVSKITDPSPFDLQFFMGTKNNTGGQVGFHLMYDDRSGFGLSDNLKFGIAGGSVVVDISANDTYTTQAYHISEITYERGITGDDAKEYIDGSLVGSGDEQNAPSSNNPQATLQIGRDTSDGNLLKGDIAEIIIYNDAKGSADRQRVRDYLTTKYSL